MKEIESLDTTIDGINLDKMQKINYSPKSFEAMFRIRKRYRMLYISKKVPNEIQSIQK